MENEAQYEYRYFGFGATTSREMLTAITGVEPVLIGPSVLHDFQLCIQGIDDIPAGDQNPRAILERVWGNVFKSYALKKRVGARVVGMLFGVTQPQLESLKRWELCDEGWMIEQRVHVRCNIDRQILAARTHVITSDQTATFVVDESLTPWLISKEQLLEAARCTAANY